MRLLASHVEDGEHRDAIASHVATTVTLQTVVE
jgi:hypothetical protein